MVKTKGKTSVKSYQQGIDLEKEKMADYSKKMKSNVRSLQNDIKKEKKEFSDYALKMRAKVNKFEADIKHQMHENKEAAAKLDRAVKFLVSESHKKQRDFQDYLKGPFQGYIKAFWG